MEEENNNEDAHLDNYTQKKIKEGIENLMEEKDLKIKWRKELEENPAVIEYCKGYYGNPIKQFLDSYINTKYSYYQYGDMYKDIIERKRDQWINEAHEQLECILQKQLFDKQCLWRARQLTIEGVVVTYDFKVWEHDILNCPFLDPISTSDIKLYQDFLYQGNLEPFYLDSQGWQDHEEIKAFYNSNDDEDNYVMPDWYDYHNNKTGNGSLLLLPDIVGQKENFYTTLYHEAKDETREKTHEPAHEVDKRPFLSYYDKETIKFFVTTFEDAETQKKHKYYTEGTINNSGKIDFQNTINSILEADELIPIESHYNIKEAVEIAYNKYYFRKIADHLPLAHEQYLFNKKMGFKFEKERPNIYIRFRDDLIRMILEARTLNGEEQNFDY